MNSRFAGASTIALATLFLTQGYAQSAHAATATSDEGDTVVVTGTRTTGLTAANSPAPIQVLGKDVLSRVGQPDLSQTLAQILPSVQVQAWGTDQEEFNLTFRLRGLSPNETLVLVNGERLHGTANLAVAGGPYGGGAAPDVSFIPVGAIDHIEVLQDGAAAQYGTDAIAGVVNIILKKNTHGGQVSASGGQYFDGGGLTGEFSAMAGFAPIDKSYLDLTFESKFHGISVRNAPDPVVLNTGVAANTKANLLGLYPAIASYPGYPNVVRITGDPQLQQYNFVANAGYEVSPNVDFYADANLGYKLGRHNENYRTPTVVVGPTGQIAFPGGFYPQENQRNLDYSVTAGFKGDLNGTTWNLASAYGKDHASIYVLGSANATLYAQTGASPSTFYDGAYAASQWTNTLDLTHKFNLGWAGPATLAGGVEYRVETYQLSAGDPSSYYGTGAQSFPGYSPANASSHQRDNWAVYGDLALQPVAALKLDGAVRHENYSDFGSTTVGKLTGRYDFSQAFAVRGTVSTGFRAPTLAEEYYSGVNVNPTSISGVFAPNSAGAQQLGFSGLKPENSTNYSVGLVTHFLPHLTATVDAYSIQIDKRILQSGTIYGYSSNKTVIQSPSVLAALTANGIAIDPAIYALPVSSVGVTSFVNGADTLTRGVDFVATYPVDYGSFGHVDYSLSSNYNSTKVTHIAPPPTNVNQSVKLLDAAAVSVIENAAPLWRVTLGGYWTLNRFSVNLRESFYGSSFEFTQDPVTAAYDKIQINAALLTDLELGYKIGHGVSAFVGANNLFNHYPTKLPDYLRQEYWNLNSASYATLYPNFSSYGVNGGYYYARVAWNF